MTTDAPDEPRATLREDERALAEVLAAHLPEETPHGPLFCRPCSEAAREWVQWTPAHLAEQLASVVAAARAEVGERAWDEGRESLGLDMARPTGDDGMRPSSENPYRAARIAGTS